MNLEFWEGVSIGLTLLLALAMAAVLAVRLFGGVVW